MLMMMVVMMVTAARGFGAARMRNCNASYLWEERNNVFKWVMNTSTQNQVSHHMAVTKNHKVALHMAWRPRYKQIINNNLHFR